MNVKINVFGKGDRYESNSHRWLQGVEEKSLARGIQLEGYSLSLGAGPLQRQTGDLRLSLEYSKKPLRLLE